MTTISLKWEKKRKNKTPVTDNFPPFSNDDARETVQGLFVLLLNPDFPASLSSSLLIMWPFQKSL